METRNPSRRHVLQALAATAAASSLPSAHAQTAYPSRPIRLVVGFTAGGAADVVTRIIAKGFAAEIGTDVYVDNRPGADGIISAQEVMRAPADGYTLLLGTNTAMVAVPTTRPNPPYDPFKAFTPLTTAGEFSMFLAVSPKMPGKSLDDFLQEVAAHPQKYSSGSSNSAAELAMLQLLGTRKTRVVNVRYKGDAQAMTDLVSGQIQMMFSTGTLTPTFVKDGRIRSLVTLLPQRSPLLPDVPTARELGIGKLTITPWAGFFAPPGMAPQLTERISAALRAALARPEIRGQLVAQGFSGYGLTPAEFTAFFRRQYDAFVTTVRENNVRFD
jgi:tripartite-type tricarboxylate transporter receptor subunit TctC